MMTTNSCPLLTSQHQYRWRELVPAFDSLVTQDDILQHKSFVKGYLLAMRDAGLGTFDFERLTKAVENCAQAANNLRAQKRKRSGNTSSEALPSPTIARLEIGDVV